MASISEANSWPFYHFGLIVTGKGERAFLPSLFRSLMASGRCTFQVFRQIGQRSPITSQKRVLKMTGTGKTIPDKDVEEIGLPARKFLREKRIALVLLVDDLEYDRAAQARGVFQRYRDVFAKILGEHRHRASVHFLVNMLEAYYFAHADAINAVLGTQLADYPDDVETIRHPKEELKRLHHGFDEVEHGQAIMSGLDVEHVLSRQEACASLRALFGWCSKAIRQQPTAQFRLEDGVYSTLTGPQIGNL
jgi:hypothetical protein